MLKFRFDVTNGLPFQKIPRRKCTQRYKGFVEWPRTDDATFKNLHLTKTTTSLKQKHFIISVISSQIPHLKR